MDIENKTFQDWIFIELNTISFLLDLSNSNKKLSLSLIDKFISDFELQASISDINDLSELLKELQIILTKIEKDDIELLNFKNKFNSIKDTYNVEELNSIIDTFKNKQISMQSTQLQLYSYTPKLLNYINVCKTNVNKPIRTNSITPKGNEESLKINIINTPQSSIKKTCDEKNKGIGTLIISEKTGKVTLPYSKEVIELSKFKNLSISRFRETFNLVKNREQSNLSEAFSLAFELMFRYDLHPAIIAACKNIDELDIYISCLDNNVLDEFPFFEVKFEIPPILKKLNKKL